MKAIAALIVLLVWGLLLASVYADDVSQLQGKKSEPGFDRHHRIQPPLVTDVNGNYINVDFNWQKARDPFKRVK